MCIFQFPNVINLSVGGKKFATRLTTLRKYPDSMLAVMFSGRHAVDTDQENNYFIDRYRIAIIKSSILALFQPFATIVGSALVQWKSA